MKSQVERVYRIVATFNEVTDPVKFVFEVSALISDTEDNEHNLNAEHVKELLKGLITGGIQHGLGSTELGDNYVTEIWVHDRVVGETEPENVLLDLV